MSTAEIVHDIALRELESLLRRKLGSNLILLEQSTCPLLPAGENYGSSMLKVQVKVKRDAESPEEQLHLVAKMLPATDFQRDLFDTSFTFKKERFLYETLMPAYRQLELDFAVPEAHLFDVLPEFFGARNSLADDGDRVDDDAVILMQNLKTLGYYNADRRQGMDFEHAQLSIKALARFHALGMAMKRHRAESFARIRQRSKCFTIQGGTSFDEPRLAILRLMRDDPAMSEHFGRLEMAMTQESATSWTAVPPEPWSTIVHADFWINNIMFRKDANNADRVGDLKFVDFQNFLFLSPLRELVFFVMVNLQSDVFDKKFDALIDLYYEIFIKTLESMRCEVEAFSRDKFDERLKIDAFEEFPHCPFMIKIMTADVNAGDDVDIKERMMGGLPNDMYLNKLRRCVSKYAEKKWLG